MILAILIHSALCWNEELNIIATEIYFRQLGDTPHTAVKAVLELNNEKLERDSILGAWISTVELPPINTKVFHHWRFVQTPIIKSEGNITQHENLDDLLAELKEFNNSLYKKTVTAPWPYTLAYKSFYGLTFDLYSPVHNAELFRLPSKDGKTIYFEDGDDSGQKFYIKYNGVNISLYDFWESGCGEFTKKLPFTKEDWAEVDRLVDELRENTPYSTKEVTKSIDIVHQESHSLAVNNVYTIDIDTELSDDDDYVKKCREITHERIVNAAYKLAASTKYVYVPQFASNPPGQFISLSGLMSWAILALLVPTFLYLVWDFCHLKMKME